MKIPSVVELKLLALVEGGERSGRDVATLHEREFGKRISAGTLYTTFRHMREAGWVLVRDEEEDDRRVRYFSLSADGRRALAEGRLYYQRVSAFKLPPERAQA